MPFPRILTDRSALAGGWANFCASNCALKTCLGQTPNKQESHRLGKLLGVPVPERHSVHVRGVSLHQFMGWGAKTER